MKIKDINKHFKDYEPDEEVFIMWWDKEDFDESFPKKMTDQEWITVVKAMHNYGFDAMTWDLVGAIEDELETIRNE